MKAGSLYKQQEVCLMMGIYTELLVLGVGLIALFLILYFTEEG